MLLIDSPTRVRLVGQQYEKQAESIRNALTYIDKTVQFELARLKKNPWYVNQHGEEKYREELERLKNEMRVCLLKIDSKGLWTYSGLAKRIQGVAGGDIVSEVSYPDPGVIPWSKQPTETARYYQEQAVQNLLRVKHGAVSIATGLGKSMCIRTLAKELALKTLVVAPSVSIARQLYRDFAKHFGTNRVGLYGDGKKEFGKRIVIGLFQSLAKVPAESPAWEELAKTQVFIVDESHLTPASTLKHVCEGLAKNAPYRFFFSGTQMRNDGADLLLEGIIGPVVYEMDVRRGVDEGFLSKPNFKMVEMWSPSSFVSGNPDAMLDRHFYSNRDMYRKAAEIANKSIDLLGHQVLILIEEITQFQYLLPYLTHRPGFAHGGVTKTNRVTVPEDFWKSDPEALVDQLNSGNLNLLVGTSCISIGTDIRTPKTIINLQGGLSEVKIRQAVGRGTRRTPDKDSFNYFDFCVKVRHPEDPNFVAITHRHARERAAIYQDIYPSLQVIK